jgi:hypothetical protein
MDRAQHLPLAHRAAARNGGGAGNAHNPMMDSKH